MGLWGRSSHFPIVSAITLPSQGPHSVRDKMLETAAKFPSSGDSCSGTESAARPPPAIVQGPGQHLVRQLCAGPSSAPPTHTPTGRAPYRTCTLQDVHPEQVASAGCWLLHRCPQGGAVGKGSGPGQPRAVPRQMLERGCGGAIAPQDEGMAGGSPEDTALGKRQPLRFCPEPLRCPCPHPLSLPGWSNPGGRE